MDDVIHAIQKHRKKLTESQRNLAEYVASNTERAAFLTASELANQTGVSESSVIRFARAIGYDGYPHLQNALQNMLRRQLTTVDRLQSSTEDLKEDSDIIEKVMLSDVDNIRNTLTGLDREMFKKIVDALLEAERIHVIGSRGASGPAYVLGFGLNWVLRNVNTPIYGPADELDSMMSIDSGDLVMALSFPRYTRVTVDMFKIAAERGAVNVALTDGVMSPLLEHADYWLIARSGQVSYADSLCAPLSLINALLAAVGARNQEKTKTALAEMEQMWDEYSVYESSSHQNGGSD